MPKTIDTAITGPFDLDHASQNPLTITSAGSITSTGAGEDGIDGVAGVAWSILNDGAVSSAGGYGVDLAGAGSLNNSGTVSGLTSGFVTGGSGTVVNQGTITGTSGDGVSFGHGGSVANSKAGSITGGTYGVEIAGASGVVTNNGAISGADDGIDLTAGGQVTNNADGSISVSAPASSGNGVEITGGYGSVTNYGVIAADYNGADILLNDGGVVRNDGSLNPSDGSPGQPGTTGVEIANGAGFVINNGTIQGGYRQGPAVVLEDGGSVVNQGNGAIYGGSGTEGNLGEGVQIDGEGSLTNLAGGVIDGGQAVDLEGCGTVTNQGDIGGAYESVGVLLEAGGSVTNEAGGSITGSSRGEAILLLNGGSVTNEKGGTISGVAAAISTNLSGSVINAGVISNDGRSGVTLGDGGSVINEKGGSISAASNAVQVEAGSGVVTNAGTISAVDPNTNAPEDSVVFSAGTTDNWLIVDPGAVFVGVADATQATDSTLELARGTGAISGIGTTEFLGFNTLAVDNHADWTLSGANTIATVLDKGLLQVSDGAFDISTAIDPDSTGTFEIAAGATLDVAAALGADTTMMFTAGSEVVIGDFAQFGENIGTRQYQGSLLTGFGGSTIDLDGFSMTDLQSSFSKHSGLLQLSNGDSQMATLDFQTSTLGAGTFHFASDGNNGVLITHS
jgi:hypothetical protein